MAYIFTRRTTGINYTSFDVDDEDLRKKDIRWADFLAGCAPCRPEDGIKSATQQKLTSGRLPDIFTIRTNHICHQRFKDFVEEWEPGLHFFESIELKRKNGERIGDYYLWTVGQDIDCILTERLEGFWRSYDDGVSTEFSMSNASTHAHYQHMHPEKGDGTKIEISGPAVAGRHLWTAGLLARTGRGGQYFFMSDAMYAAYKKEKFQAMSLECPAEEVDRPWVAEQNMGPMLELWAAREIEIDKNWPRSPPRHGGTA